MYMLSAYNVDCSKMSLAEFYTKSVALEAFVNQVMNDWIMVELVKDGKLVCRALKA